MSIIIDSHTHRYPEEVFSNPTDWAKNHKETHWGLLTAPPNKPSIQGWADKKKMIDDMHVAGVDKAVLLGWYWQNQATCDLQNQWHLNWIKEDPDRFIAFAAVQPLEGDKAFDAVQKAIDDGCRGIGEMHPAAQAYPMNHPTWLKILDWAQNNNIPVNLHVTEPVGSSYEGKVITPLAHIQWLIQQFPHLKIILAHWGGGLPFYELNKVFRENFKNVYYDTSASPLLYDPKIYKSVYDIVGSDKILFGSDYPLRLYPKTEQEPTFISILDEVKNSGLQSDDLSKILGKNAQKLFLQ